jgi:hypothetical protein
MTTTLSPPILFTALTQLQSEDENVILQRLYDRDQELLTGLLELMTIRADLFAQFGRVDTVEQRLRSMNSVINAIINSFYLDIDENGIVPDNYDFFLTLIADLKRNINSINAVVGGIVNFLNVQSLVGPLADRLAVLEDLDILIREKLNYIYGKWDVNPADDILSL